jgi:hypothetical protein
VRSYVTGLSRNTVPSLIYLNTFNCGGMEPVVDGSRVAFFPQALVYPHPSGGTPLYDSIISAVDKLELIEDNGEANINLIIITDGEDTESAASADECAGLLDEKRAAGWTILYISVDKNAADEAANLRLPPGTFASFRGQSLESVMRDLAGKRAESIATNRPLLLSDLRGQL